MCFFVRWPWNKLKPLNAAYITPAGAFAQAGKNVNNLGKTYTLPRGLFTSSL
jgi:hypothetical protein